MKKFLSLKYLTSACFLALLGIMLAGSLRPVYYEAYHQLQNLRSGNGISISEIEYEYNDALPGKQLYITLNGGFRRLLGQRSVNKRYRLDNGHLAYVIPETDVTAPAESIAAFRDGSIWRMVVVIYKLEIEEGTPLKISAESKELRFFTREELKDIDIVITHSDIVEDWFINKE